MAIVAARHRYRAIGGQCTASPPAIEAGLRAVSLKSVTVYAQNSDQRCETRWYLHNQESLLGDFDQRLTEILAVKQFEERFREVLQSFGDIFSRLDSAFCQPASERLNCLAITLRVIEDDEPLHAGAVDR